MTAGTTEDADYTVKNGAVTFAANGDANATRTITIRVTDDDLSETSETFSVGLGPKAGDQASVVHVKTTAKNATATIAESDPITVSISGPSTVDEGDTTTAYTVSLSPDAVTPTSRPDGGLRHRRRHGR